VFSKENAALGDALYADVAELQETAKSHRFLSLIAGSHRVLTLCKSDWFSNLQLPATGTAFFVAANRDGLQAGRSPR
jgi:hypothetical protein